MSSSVYSCGTTFTSKYTEMHESLDGIQLKKNFNEGIPKVCLYYSEFAKDLLQIVYSGRLILSSPSGVFTLFRRTVRNETTFGTSRGNKVYYTVKISENYPYMLQEDLTETNDSLKRELTGYAIVGIESGNLNSKTLPEPFTYFGSGVIGNYGESIRYSRNNGKFLSQKYLSGVSENKEYRKRFWRPDGTIIAENTLC